MLFSRYVVVDPLSLFFSAMASLDGTGGGEEENEIYGNSVGLE